jgi:hypothetical protein
MKKALLLRVEMYWKGLEVLPQVCYWNVLPEHVQSNVTGAATRNEMMVRTYTATEDDPAATRKPYFDYDGTLLAGEGDRQAFIDYEGVRHFEGKHDTVQ